MSHRDVKIMITAFAATAINLLAPIPGAFACTLSRTLQKGSRGTDVVCLQNLLITNKFLTGEATGYFGEKTKTAVKNFQKSKDISPALGVVGPVTRAALASLAVAELSPASTAAASQTTTSSSTLTTTTASPTTPMTSNKLKVTAATLEQQPPPAAIRRVRAAMDEIGTLTFTADPTYYTTIQSFTIKFSGSAVPDASTPFSVTLKSLTGTSAQTCTPGAGNSCSVTFTPSPSYGLSPSTSKTVKIRIDSSSFPDIIGQVEALTASIPSASDMTWSDGVSNNIPMEPGLFPMVITNAFYD